MGKWAEAAAAAGVDPNPPSQPQPAAAAAGADPVAVPAPEHREAIPDQSPKEAQPADDNPVLKERPLRPTDVRHIHKMVDRVAGRIGRIWGKDWSFTKEEIDDLNDHGARFFSRWIKTSWGVSTFAYFGTLGGKLVGEAIESYMEAREVAKVERTDDRAQPTHVTEATPAAASVEVPAADGSNGRVKIDPATVEIKDSGPGRM